LTLQFKGIIISFRRKSKRRFDMRAKVMFYDEKTGEIFQEYDRAIFIGRKPLTDKGYVKVFVAFFKDVLENKRLGKGAWKLLLYIIDRLPYDSLEVHLVPQKVAKDLGITERTFYTWLKVLLEEGFLEKLARNVYLLRPYTAVKGYMAKATASIPDF
jgi:hypothetical protein